MPSPLTRQQLLPEPELPASPDLLAAGRRLARDRHRGRLSVPDR